MAEEEASDIGVEHNQFLFIKTPGGDLDKTRVVCKYCCDVLSYHQSTMSLKYHLKAKHFMYASASRSSSTELAGSHVRQVKITECNQGKPVSKATTTRLKNAMAKWVAMDCRPVSIVEDQGLQEIIQIASGDPFYK